MVSTPRSCRMPRFCAWRRVMAGLWTVGCTGWGWRFVNKRYIRLYKYHDNKNILKYLVQTCNSRFLKHGTHTHILDSTTANGMQTMVRLGGDGHKHIYIYIHVCDRKPAGLYIQDESFYESSFWQTIPNYATAPNLTKLPAWFPLGSTCDLSRCVFVVFVCLCCAVEQSVVPCSSSRRKLLDVTEHAKLGLWIKTHSARVRLDVPGGKQTPALHCLELTWPWKTALFSSPNSGVPPNGRAWVSPPVAPEAGWTNHGRHVIGAWEVSERRMRRS